jgi:hypothetical protein
MKITLNIILFSLQTGAKNGTAIGTTYLDITHGDFSSSTSTAKTKLITTIVSTTSSSTTASIATTMTMQKESE